MIDKLEEVERRFDRLTAEMSNPTVYSDSARYQKIARERSGIEKLKLTISLMTANNPAWGLHPDSAPTQLQPTTGKPAATGTGRFGTRPAGSN